MKFSSIFKQNRMLYKLTGGRWEEYIDDGSFENYCFCRNVESILSKKSRPLDANILLLRFEKEYSVMVVCVKNEYKILAKTYAGTECLDTSLNTCWEMIDRHDSLVCGIRRKYPLTPMEE